MHITLLFGILPPEHYEEIISCSKGGIQYAADALQKSIISGVGNLSSSISLINLPFIGSYPNRYTQLRIPSFSINYKVGNRTIEGKNIGFSNLSGYKLFSRYWNAKHALSVLEEENVILIYSIHLPFLKAAVDIKKKRKNVKIVLIVPDLPEYMAANKNVVRKILEFFNSKFLSYQYKYVDGYVLLSKHMIDRLPINEKPWTVVEGIFNPQDDATYIEEDKASRYILYTGTLAKRYGVMNLVEAFQKLPNEDIRLIICGDGDSKDDIIKASSIDNRIIFKGLIKRDEALKLQKNATLLVNPRTPEGEFTKYSFPSKTMEYLASGVPTLLYKLPGIPEEYYDYCFSLEDLSIEALTDQLRVILQMKKEELREIGEKARNFIFENKLPISQSKKIMDLISEF